MCGGGGWGVCWGWAWVCCRRHRWIRTIAGAPMLEAMLDHADSTAFCFDNSVKITSRFCIDISSALLLYFYLYLSPLSCLFSKSFIHWFCFVVVFQQLMSEYCSYVSVALTAWAKGTTLSFSGLQSMLWK